MQSKRKIIVTFILMLLIVTTACSENSINGNKTDKQIMIEIDKELFPESTVETIYLHKNITLKEMIDMIGKPDAHVGGVRHPFFLVWKMQDGRELNITFSGSDYQDFREKLYSNEFVLPDEDPGSEIIYSWQSLSPNEQKVVKEWCLKTRAVKAYIRETGKDDIVLFE